MRLIQFSKIVLAVGMMLLLIICACLFFATKLLAYDERVDIAFEIIQPITVMVCLAGARCGL